MAHHRYALPRGKTLLTKRFRFASVGTSPSAHHGSIRSAIALHKLDSSDQHRFPVHGSIEGTVSMNVGKGPTACGKFLSTPSQPLLQEPQLHNLLRRHPRFPRRVHPCPPKRGDLEQTSDLEDETPLLNTTFVISTSWEIFRLEHPTRPAQAPSCNRGGNRRGWWGSKLSF